MQVLIVESKINEKSGVSRKTGQAYTLRQQAAVLALGKYDMRPFTLTLSRDQAAYEPGQYALDGSSFKVDDFGELRLGRVRLVKVVAAVPAAKAG